MQTPADKNFSPMVSACRPSGIIGNNTLVVNWRKYPDITDIMITPSIETKNDTFI